ncbi:hypothetical protein OKW30_008111 [Paraburkholderia sp. Clong3]|uniref:hypothetical protein n=1 Tax=Paraburkholderia sp. Clong3 TaxID=2991061 RepID=UPI003D208FDB
MDWLQRLIQVPFVLVMSARNSTATLEIDGSVAELLSVGDSTFIGVVLRGIATDRDENWLIRATLMLAAREDALDDALQWNKGRWLIWRRYGLETFEAQDGALEQRLTAHLELARGLNSIAKPRRRLLNSNVGNLV